jgi:2-polyprenyl-6-methoxyphenol hydroxylase-like FAD-dependent oxidoreductase
VRRRAAREVTALSYQTEQPIVIVGAGPVGLTLACELYRHGVSCRILDRRVDPAIDSRATDIHARTLEIFDDLGIADQVLATGKKVTRFRAYSEGRNVVDLNLDELSSRYRFAIALPQADTEAILVERLEELGGQVERGVTAREISPGADQVQLALEHQGGRRERLSCEWLVGCDGVRSDVRHAAKIRFPGIAYPERYLVVDADIEWELPHNQVHLFAARGGFVNVLAMPNGERRVRILANQSSQHGSADVVAMRHLMRQRMGVPAKIVNPTFSSRFRVARKLASHYRRGRVLLAGDAAHVCSPLLGQGMNVGIQDAHNLAWKMALVATGASHPRLLDSYEEERRPVARGVLLATHTMHSLATLRVPAATTLRDSLAKWAHVVPGFSRLATTACSEIGTHYHGSPNVGGDRRRWSSAVNLPGNLQLRSLVSSRDYAPVPGDQAPNPLLPDSCGPGSGGRHLHDFFGSLYTLLIFSGHEGNSTPPELGEAASSIVKRHGARVVVVRVGTGRSERWGRSGIEEVDGDTRGIHQCFHASEGALCLVRPDGHIGFRAQLDQAAQLGQHLTQIFPTPCEDEPAVQVTAQQRTRSSSSIPRLQLFEFSDQDWLPAALRDGLTGYLQTLSRALGIHEHVAPLVEEALQDSGTDQVVDLCSGGGGPILEIRKLLERRVPVVLTDKYPNQRVFEQLAEHGVRGHTDPVDATAVDGTLSGMRTLINALHHFPPSVAKDVLADAAKRNEPIIVVELSRRTALTVLATPLIIPSTLLLMPLVRPICWEFLLSTYVFPLLPLMIFWDGLVSNLRAYTVDELRAMTEGLGDEQYQWQIDDMPVGFVKATVLVGMPGVNNKPAQRRRAAPMCYRARYAMADRAGCLMAA